MADQNLVSYARQKATEYGIDPDLYEAQLFQESKFDPSAYNEKSGATGIAQIMPDTALQPGFGTTPISLEDRLDPYKSIEFGAQYMKGLTDYYGGDYNLALAAYNAGPGTVNKAGGIPNIAETQNYVSIITGGTLLSPQTTPHATELDYRSQQLNALTYQKQELLALKSTDVQGISGADISTYAGSVLTSEEKARFEQNTNQLLRDMELGTASGQLKNVAAALGAGAITVVGNTVTLGANTRIALNRAYPDENSAAVIDSLLPFVEYVDAVEARAQAMVNRSGIQQIEKRVQPYSDAAALAFEKGDYLGAFSNALVGAVVGASSDPLAAATMFAESVPQMYVTAKSYLGSTALLTADYTREFYEDFKQTNGRDPVGSEVGVIMAMSFLAAVPDTLSDKLLAKGVPTITNGLSKLATTVGVPQKSIARTLSRITGNAIGQPAQELLAGASTELASQYAAVQDTSRLDPTEIAQQGILEAVAVGPLQGARVAANVVGTGAQELTKRAIDAEIRATEAAAQTEQVLDTTAAAVEAARTQTLSPEPQGLDPVSSLQFYVAQTIGERKQLGDADSDIFVDAREKLQAAVDYVATLDETEYDQEDLDVLAQYERLINSLNPNQTAPEVNTREAVGNIVAPTAPLAVNQEQQSKDAVLYSMKTSFDITEDEAKQLLRSGKFDDDGKKQIRQYIKRVKDMQQVAGEVSGGANYKFRGATVRAKTILNKLAQGDIEGARSEYNYLRNFAIYQANKAKAFKAVAAHTKNDPLPEGIYDVTFNSDGSINTFKVTNDIGVDRQFSKERGLSKLADRVSVEANIINSIINSLGQDIRKAKQATKKPTTKRNKTTPKTVVKETAAKPKEAKPVTPKQYNYKGVAVTFFPKGAKELNGALAKTTVVDGQYVIYMQQNLTTKQAIDYITGQSDQTHSSIQKQIVTKFMQDNYGVNLPLIISKMSDQKLRKFILDHEIAHIENQDARRSNYFANPEQAIAAKYDLANKANKYLGDSSIRIEARANLLALNMKAKARQLTTEIDEVSAVIDNTAEFTAAAENMSFEQLQAQISKLENEQSVREEAINDPQKLAELAQKQRLPVSRLLASLTNKYNIVSAQIDAFKTVLSTKQPTVEVTDQLAFDFDETSEVSVKDTKNTKTFKLNSVLNAIKLINSAGTTLASYVLPKSLVRKLKVEDSVEVNENNADEVAYSPSSAVSVFRKFSNFMDQYRNGDVTITGNKLQKQIIDKILLPFNDQFAAQFKKTNGVLAISEKFKFYAAEFKTKNGNINKFLQNPFMHFFDGENSPFDKSPSGVRIENPTIDPNVVSALSLAALNWIGSEGRSTLTNTDQIINAILGREGKTPISNEEYAVLGQAGVPLRTVAETIGKSFLDSLGLTGNPESAENAGNKMELAAGIAALQVLEDLGYIQINEVPRSTLQQFNPDIVVDFDRNISLVRVVENNTQNIYNRYKDINGVTEDGISHVLDKVFGLPTRRKLPKFFPTMKGRDATYLRSNQKLPKQVRNDVNAHQAIPFNFKPEMKNFLEVKDREFFRTLMGYKPVEQVPLNLQDSQKTKNNLIDREIDQVFEFYQIAKFNGFKDFFFEYNTWSNSRHGVANSDFNYQNNKLARHVIQATGWDNSISMRDSTAITRMFYGIAQGLGISIDKKRPEDIISALQDIRIDPEFGRAIEAVRKLYKKPNDAAAKQYLSEYSSSKEGIFTVDALMAYERYMTAQIKGKERLNINIAMEIDAVTSGSAIATMAAGIITPNGVGTMEASGIFLKGSPYLTYPHFKDPLLNNRDNYEKLVDLWREEFLNAEEDMRHMESANSLLKKLIPNFDSKEARNLAKDPVMKTNYQAAIRTAVRDFIKVQAAAVIAKAESDPETVQAYLQEVLETNRPFDLYKNKLTNAQIKAIEDHIYSLYGTSLFNALEQYNPEIKAYGSAVNNGMNAMFWIFSAKFNKAKKKFLLANKKQAKDLSRLDIEEILTSKEMEIFLPLYRYFDSKDGTEGMVGYGRQRVIDTTSDSAVEVSKATYTKQGEIREVNKSAQAYRYTFSDPGVSGMVKFIQSLDDKLIRSLFGQNAMTVFDAVLASPMDTGNLGKTYNTALLDVTQEFSPAGEVIAVLGKASRKLDDLTNDDLVAVLGDFNITINNNLQMIEDIFGLERDENNKVDYSSIDVKGVINRFYDDLKTAYGDEQRGKTIIKRDVQSIDHMVGVGTQQLKVTAAEANLSKLNEDLTQEFLGSMPESSGQDFTPDSVYEVTSDNVRTVFEQLSKIGNVKDSSTHTNRLLNLADTLYSQVLSQLGRHIVGVRDSNNRTNGWLSNKRVFIENNRGTVKTNLDMSALEVAAHEFGHAVTKAGIADPNNEAVVRELTRLQQEVKRALNLKYKGEGWRAFLNHDSQGNVIFRTNEALEIKTAKDQFDYMFNDKNLVEVEYTNADGKVRKTRQRRALLEFVAFGLTNERLTTEMQGITFTKGKIATSNSFFGKLEALFIKLVDSISRKLHKTKDITADQALLEMAYELNRSHTKHAFTTQRVMSSIDEANHSVSKKWISHVLRPLGAFNWRIYHKTMASDSKLGLAVNAVTLGLGTILPPNSKTDAGVSEDLLLNAIDETRRRLGKAKRGLVYEIMRQIIPSQDPYMGRLEWLQLKSKNLVDTTRERTIDEVRKLIQASFTQPLNQRETEVLTLGLLQTDVSSLYNELTPKNAQQLVRFLRNTNGARTAEIKQLINDIKAQFPTQAANYFINQARSLGHFMSQGTALVKDQGMNAYTIANGLLVENFPKVPESGPAEALIDKLATLYSIEYNTVDTNNLTADLINREMEANPTSNGIRSMFGLHKGFKQRALDENFDGNKAMLMKGYTKQVFSPHIEVRVGTKDDEAAMAEEHFIPVAQLGKDKSDTTNNDRVLYVNTAAGLGRYDKSIISLTSETVRGSSIRNGNMDSGSIGEAYLANLKNIKTIKQNNRMDVQRQMASDSYQSNETNIMVPSVDESGSIYDYRYMMDNHTRQTVLEQRLDGTEILARMFGTIEDKTNSRAVNHHTVDVLKQDYDENFKKFPSDYTLISPDSTNSEAVEIWRMMPKESQLYVKKVFGEGQFFVRTEALDIVFGRRRFQLSKNQHAKIFRIAEAVWKEIVTFAKVNIVIKNPAVIIANIFSNTLAGFMRGIPVEQMIKGQLRGIRLLNNYQKDLGRLTQLRAEYEAAKASGQSTKNIEAEMSAVANLLENSKLKPLIEAGLFQTIVEDVNVQSFNEEGYIEEVFGKIKLKVPKVLRQDPIASKARVATDWALLTRNTGAYKLLLKGTQYSDFVARFAMYEYRTELAPKENRWTHEQALRAVLDMYVNYEAPTNKYLQYLDDVGLYMFIKYPTRIIRAIYSAFANNPLNALGLVALEASLNPETPFDANFLGVWNPMRGLNMGIDSATTLPLTHILP